MPTDDLTQLLRHMEWADASVWNAVLDQAVTGSDDRTKDLLHHLHGVQWAYLQIWRGDQPEMPDVTAFSDLAAIHRWSRDFYPQLWDFWNAVDSELLAQQVVFPWADRLVKRWGAAHPVTFAESAQQLCSHSTYHRGQVNMRLRQLGGEPPLVDFVAWIWVGRPEPTWEQAI